MQDLRARLHSALHDGFVAPVWGAPQVMHQALKAIRKDFDGAAADVPEHSIAQAVMRFRRTGTFDSFRDLKYACYGLALRLGEDDYTLLGDEQRYPALLCKVQERTNAPRRFRKCFQGLLNSYLNFPHDESCTDIERQNWEHLRDYLRGQLQGILTIEPVASWIQTLNAHENLLTPAPCQRYTDGLREGNWNELEDLAQGLAISSESWVWKKAVLTYVETVAEMRADGDFRQSLKSALHALDNELGGKHIHLGDELRKCGTASLLRRYARCSEHPQHEALLDQALQCFGKPWLHRTAWDAYVADEDARRMVDGWIKTELIRDFFQLLADDGVANPERMHFWPQFVPVISDIWFALGPHALHNRNPAYEKLRQRIGRERILKFAGAVATNNAFIMRIDPFYLVEFGQTGRAAYLVHAELWNVPLSFGATVDLTVQRLRAMGGEQMRHAAPLPWERHFCNAICPRIGWWPPSFQPSGRRALPQTSRPTALRSTAPQSAPEVDPVFVSLKRKIAEFGKEMEDRRPQGGCLWVRADDKDPSLTRFLSSQGFRYSEGKGWWKK